MTICTDNHSECNPGSGHCPIHGYDDSIPPPVGFRWHRVTGQDGQVYSALVMEEVK